MNNMLKLAGLEIESAKQKDVKDRFLAGEEVSGSGKVKCWRSNDTGMLATASGEGFESFSTRWPFHGLTGMWIRKRGCCFSYSKRLYTVRRVVTIGERGQATRYKVSLMAGTMHQSIENCGATVCNT